MIVVIALMAASAAFVAMTWVATASSYKTLPDRVPLHFALDGTPSWFGPRPLIWTVPVVELLSVVIIGSGAIAERGIHNTHGTLTGVLVFSACIFAALWRGQLLMIEASQRAEPRLPMQKAILTVLPVAAIGIGALFLL